MASMEPRIVGTGGLVLRWWEAGPSDAAVIEDIVESSRTEFARWLPGTMGDLADLDAWFAAVGRRIEEEAGWYYAIEVDGVAIGQCSLNARDDGTAEIGYWVRTDRTGEGIAPRAVVAMSEAAFRHGFLALIIHCDAGNERSAAVARRSGFRHVGTADLDPLLPRTDAQTGREMTWRLER
jgi:RimJ/RimL family protein N-acetyltransferase